VNQSPRTPWSRALALVAVATVVLAGCNDLWTPDKYPYTTVWPVTDFGDLTQVLYAEITWWTIGIFVAVIALLGFILVRFRDDGSPGNPKQIHGNPQLEFAWTLLPVVIVISITVPTIRTIFQQQDAPPSNAVEIQVTGRRWWWDFKYLKSGVVTGNEFYLPIGQPISLLIESDTVIHSFWIPRLGGKRDAVPGRVNRIWFTINGDKAVPGKPIEYLGECAEFCGDQHARMRMRAYGVSPEDFEKYLTDMQTPVKLQDAALQAKGEDLFGTAGCGGCHTIVGNPKANGQIGPNLTRFGNRHSIGAGADLLDGMNDDQKVAELKRWLTNPDDIKYGTTQQANPSRALDGMNIPRALAPDEIDTLAHYLVAQK